jgi:hypothetical protein
MQAQYAFVGQERLDCVNGLAHMTKALGDVHPPFFVIF